MRQSSCSCHQYLTSISPVAYHQYLIIINSPVNHQYLTSTSQVTHCRLCTCFSFSSSLRSKVGATACSLPGRSFFAMWFTHQQLNMLSWSAQPMIFPAPIIIHVPNQSHTFRAKSNLCISVEDEFGETCQGADNGTSCSEVHQTLYRH